MKMEDKSGMPLRALERLLPLLIAVFIAVFCFVMMVPDLSFEGHWFKDLMFKSRKMLDLEDPPSDDIAFVDMDDQSYRQLRTAMMDRKEHMAPVIEALGDLGARHLVLDIEFFDPVRPRLNEDVGEKLAGAIEPLIETLAGIKTADEFERRGEFGMALNPLVLDLKRLSEDPNVDFAASLGRILSTLGMHHNEAAGVTRDAAVEAGRPTLEALVRTEALPAPRPTSLWLVPPEGSLYRLLNPGFTSWGLVNSPSSEDGLVRTTRLHADVGRHRYFNLALRAYLSDQKIPLSSLVIDDAKMEAAHVSIPVSEEGDYTIDWNSLLLDDPSKRVPFVRLHDMKTAERAARIALHAAMILEEKEYERLTSHSDYRLKRKGALDPAGATPQELLAGVERLAPLAPMTSFPEAVRQKLDEAAGHLKQWRERHERLGWLMDKVVFIGAAGTSSIDRRPTPIAPHVPMVNLHATVFNSLIQGRHIRHVAPMAELMASALLLGLLSWVSMRFPPKIVAVSAFALSWVITALGLFLFMQGWLLRWGGSVIEAGGWLITGITFTRNLISFKRERVLRDRLSHLTPDMIAHVRKAKDGELSGKGQVTVLHVAFHDFSRFCQGLSASEVRDRIQGILVAFKPVISEHGGVPEKFDGRGLAVFFGAIQQREDPARRACLCARALACLQVPPGPGGGAGVLEWGIGISTGEAVFGSFGTHSRFDLSVVGPCADMARKLSGVARHGKRILLDEVTHIASAGADGAKALEPIAIEGLEGIWMMESKKG